MYRHKGAGGHVETSCQLLGINIKINQTLEVHQVSSALQTAMVSLSGFTSSKVVTASAKQKKAPSAATSTVTAVAPATREYILIAVAELAAKQNRDLKKWEADARTAEADAANAAKVAAAPGDGSESDEDAAVPKQSFHLGVAAQRYANNLRDGGKSENNNLPNGFPK